MGGGDLATTIDVMTGLDVAEEKEFHPMYEEKKRETARRAKMG